MGGVDDVVVKRVIQLRHVKGIPTIGREDPRLISRGGIIGVIGREHPLLAVLAVVEHYAGHLQWPVFRTPPAPLLLLLCQAPVVSDDSSQKVVDRARLPQARGARQQQAAHTG